MCKNWSKYVIYFLVFCVIGWFYELGWEIGMGHGLVNRGFLYGPYLPIYGVGVLLLYLLLHKLMKKDIKIGKFKVTPIIVFLCIMVIVSVVEFIGSVILEKAFNLQMWDYSSDILNLQGRISLRNSTLLSLGAMLMLYIVWPFLDKAHEKLNIKVSRVIAVVIIIVMVIDLILTLMFRYK